jgi:hypothetical protein
MKLPPLAFFIFRDEQPDLKTWQKFAAFADGWNKTGFSKFTKEGKEPNGEFDHWRIVLPESIHDKELDTLCDALDKFYNSDGLMWFSEVHENRSKETMAKCPFVRFVSDGYDDSFYVNADSIFTSETTCDSCKKVAPHSGRVLATPVIDEKFLDADNDINRKYPSHRLDFVNLPNGGFLISPRVIAILKSMNVKGYEVIPVINGLTGEHSARLFLLKATKVIVDPCHEHTPRIKDAICPVCGAYNNTVAGYFHVQDSQLNGDEVFSVSRFAFSGIYFSQRVFTTFKEAGLSTLIFADGIELCEH